MKPWRYGREGIRECLGRSTRSAVAALVTALAGFCIASLAGARASAVVVITEIQYHPQGDDRELEFIEIHNETPDPVELTGYYFSAGVNFTFPERTFLDPGAYMVVCANKDRITQVYGIDNVVGNWDTATSLDSSGEAVELANPAGVVEARVRYNDRGKWPSGADGTGHSLEIKYIYSAMDDPDSWALSGRIGGSPGKPNETDLGALPLLVNEALLTPTSGERWVELYNAGAQELDLSGFHVTVDRNNLTQATLAAGTVIAAHGWLVLNESTLGLSLKTDATGRTFVAAVNPAGDRVIDARIFAPNPARSDVTEARIPDGDAQFQPSADPTPGAANHVTVSQDVVINEILYHTPDKDLRREFLELYNRGTTPANLTGWRIVDGVAFDFPNGTTIAPDAYLVVARDPDFVRDLYQLGAGAVIGPPSDDPDAADAFGSFADSGERVTIIDERENIVDTIRYFDGGEWPHWADGGGSSIELIDATQDNSKAQAWDASDESPKSPAKEYAYEGQLNGAFTATDPAEFHLVLTGPGIVLVDDLKMTSRVTTLDPTTVFVPWDDTWKYLKGTAEASDPVDAWRQINYDDSAWTDGQANIGYGDGDEKTVLDDMRKLDPNPGYATFYVRKSFNIADLAAVKDLLLEVEFDDGFAAYLNGVEVSVVNLRPGPRTNVTLAMSAKEKARESIDLTAQKGLLVAGKNVLAIEVHNQTLTSNDARFAAQFATGNFVVAEGPNLFKDGSFETDSYKTSWVMQGTHVRSGRTTQDPLSGAGSLKIVASGSGDNKVNRIETSNSGLTAPVVRTDYHISFLAKWVAGASTLLTHGSYVDVSPASYANSNHLELPQALGTPGAVNSVTLRQAARTGSKNLGPLVSRVSQNPALPAPSTPVTVTARVDDSDGVTEVLFHYSLDTPKPLGDAALLTIPMTDPDGDGYYTCEVPGQLAKKRVVYFITAKDTQGHDGRWPLDLLTRTHPLVLDEANAGPNDSNYGIYRHDTPFNGKPQSFRFWMHQANEQYLSSRPLLSNDLVDGTFIFQNRDVYYNSKIRFSGSPWARQAWSESYRMRMPKDNSLHGSIESFNMEDHQDGGARVAKERISHYLFRWHQGRTIVPYSLQWYVQLQVNDRVNEVRELVQTPNSEFVSRWFPGDDNGSFFEMDDRHVINDGGARQDSRDGFLLYPPYGAATLGADKEQYRYYFSLRLNEEDDDFSELVKFAKLLTQSQTPNEEFDKLIWDQVDVESFLRYWSIRMNTDDWDCWGTSRGKNCYLYRPKLAGKWYLFPWDMELTYGNVGAFMPPTLTATTNPVYTNKFPEVTRFINRPRVKRLYYGIMKEMIDKQFQSPFLTPYLSRLDAAGLAQQTSVGKTNGFIDQRRRSLVNVVKGVTQPAIAFKVTTNDGQPLETDSKDVVVEGKAPVEISEIAVTVNGADPAFPVDVQFSDTDVLGWKLSGEFPVGVYTLDLVGLNSDEVAVDSLSYQVTVVSPGPPQITSVSPDRVVTGERIVVTGSHWKIGFKVLFGAVEATEMTVDAGQGAVEVVVPAGVQLGPIQVSIQNPDGMTSQPFPVTVVEAKRNFIRGDSDRNGVVNLTDAIVSLRYLFQGGETPLCLDAADADDDGVINLTDALVIVRLLFQGGTALPAPYPGSGEDATADALDCALGIE